MKTTSMLLLTLLAASVLTVTAQPTDVSRFGLTGKVKRFEERQARIADKGSVKKEEKDENEESLIFDENGRLTREIYTGNGLTETRFLYDKNGIRKSITDRTDPFEKSGKLKIPGYSADVFTYDEKENSMLQESYRGKLQAGPVRELAGRSHRYKYFFDESNRLIKEVFMSPEGDEMTTEEYFYRDQTPNPADVVVSARGRARQSIKCTYEVDRVGNWTKRTKIIKAIDPRYPTTTEITYRKITYYND